MEGTWSEHLSSVLFPRVFAAVTVVFLLGKKATKGFITRLSKKCAEMILQEPVGLLSNLKMNLLEQVNPYEGISTIKQNHQSIRRFPNGQG